MNCPSCLSNCDPLISDKCVKYTGPTIPILGICSGDSLFEVETIILAKLQTALDGTGIELADVTLDCQYVEDLLDGADSTVSNLVQALLAGECDLDSRITALAAQIATPFSFNTACLTGTLTTRDLILQAVILKACAVDTRLAVVESDYIKQADLCSQVTACIAAGQSTQFNSRMVPYTVLPYYGSLSNFDNTGKGLSSVGFDKIYLMNGLNGTEDWRGRSPIGAIQNVPGGALDSAVDPSIIANAAYNISLAQKVGASNVTLTTLQFPAHIHGVTDPLHAHFTVRAQTVFGNGSSSITGNPNGTIPGRWSTDNNDEYDLQGNATAPANAGKTNSAATGISIDSTGGGQSHNNTHPSVGCLYISYIP